MSNASTSGEEVRLREALEQVPAYVPGKPAAPREGVTAYKVSSNENPYAPLPVICVVFATAASVAESGRRSV